MRSRAELVPLVKRLREEEGLTYQAIADRLGISVSHAGAIYKDPEGLKDKERKARYRAPCVDCGALTNPGAPVEEPVCRDCTDARHRRRSRAWITSSLHEWMEMHDGEVPVGNDWNPASARYKPSGVWRAERHDRTGRPWPSVSLVQKHFGSWNAMLAAHGIRPLAPWEHSIGRRGVQLRAEDQSLLNKDKETA